MPLALQLIERLQPSELRRIVPQLLKGKMTIPGTGGWDDDFSEDVLAEALQFEGLSAEYRQTILDGCRSLYQEFYSSLISGETRIDETALRRLANLVEMATPSELRAVAKAFVQLALETPNLSDSALGAATEAWLGFAQTEADISLLEAMLEKEAVAAYALNGLLRVGASTEKLTHYLAKLWEHRVAADWEVDTIFLTQRVAKEHGGENLIRRLLVLLRKDSPSIWEKVAELLKSHPTAKRWVDLVAEVQTGFITVTKPSLAHHRRTRPLNFSGTQSGILIGETGDIVFPRPEEQFNWQVFKLKKGPAVLQGLLTQSFAVELEKQHATDQMLESILRSLHKGKLASKLITK